MTYAPAPIVKTLPALIKRVEEKPPEPVLRCATCLERSYYAGVDGERCVKCAEIITDYLHTYNDLDPPSCPHRLVYSL
ncbi:MAG: hypothetical protein ACK4SY_08980 [Pyrobaculum sp.]